jgi:glycosyltransferase involved in cell wall biosynthesis
MKIVSTSYSKTETFTDPHAWLNHISFYTGLLEELAKEHRVDSIERINHEGTYYKTGVDYHFIRLQNKVVRFPWKMHRQIRRLRPDVVLVNGFIFPLQIIQLRLALGKRVKILILHRADKPFTGFKKWLQSMADKCVNAYLFASAEFGEQWIGSGIIRKREKIHEVMQSSSSFLFEEKTSAKKKHGLTGNPVYLWVGRLDQNKDPLTVIKAFLQFASRNRSVRLYMIFQSEELLEEVRTLINDSKAKESVMLIGKVVHEKLNQWYNSADFILSGSHYEGSGIAVVEAMSCGCIPIVTDIISFRALTGGNGLLYKAGDVEALQATLQFSLQLDREAQRRKILAHFQQELSFPAIAQKINYLLQAE